MRARREMATTGTLPAVCLSPPRGTKRRSGTCVKYLWIIIAALIAGFAPPNVNADTTYNVVTGFSSGTNPMGCGRMSITEPHSLTPKALAASAAQACQAGGTNEAIPNSLVIARSVTGSPVGVANQVIAPAN